MVRKRDLREIEVIELLHEIVQRLQYIYIILFILFLTNLCKTFLVRLLLILVDTNQIIQMLQCTVRFLQ